MFCSITYLQLVVCNLFFIADSLINPNLWIGIRNRFRGIVCHFLCIGNHLSGIVCHFLCQGNHFSGIAYRLRGIVYHFLCQGNRFRGIGCRFLCTGNIFTFPSHFPLSCSIHIIKNLQYKSINKFRDNSKRNSKLKGTSGEMPYFDEINIHQ